MSCSIELEGKGKFGKVVGDLPQFFGPNPPDQFIAIGKFI